MPTQAKRNPMKKPYAGQGVAVLQIGKMTGTPRITKKCYFGSGCKTHHQALPLLPHGEQPAEGDGRPCFLHTALPTSFDNTVSCTGVHTQANLLQVQLSDSLGRKQDV